MKKDRMELVFILDRSGSMSGLEEDTIGGFNAMLEKQKKEKRKINVTTVLFDNQYELLHDRLQIEGLEKMDAQQYYVRGTTALLDAVGKTIQKIIGVQKNTSPDYRADKVVFVIITDGMENASVKYTRGQIKEMISYQQDQYGWEFLFMGANMDAVAEASHYGISSKRAVSYQSDNVGTRMNFEAAGAFVMEMCTKEGEVGEGWKSEIEKRNKK